MDIEENRKRRINTARYRAEVAKRRAKSTFVHYFELAGIPANGDAVSELEGVIDDLVDAAADLAAAKVLERSI